MRQPMIHMGKGRGPKDGNDQVQNRNGQRDSHQESRAPDLHPVFAAQLG